VKRKSKPQFTPRDQRRVKVWRPKKDPVETPAAAMAQSDGLNGSEKPSDVLPKTWAEMKTFVDDLREKTEARDAEKLRGVFKDIFEAGKEKVKGYFDADRALMVAMSGFIELAASRYALDPGAQWSPGEPLRLLLAGYSGTRNTGADVRVEEMIRQFRHLFGDDHVELSIYTLDPELTRGYFRTVRQLHMPKVFPRFLFDTIHEAHAVIACEGSMFKSKFANALSTMMVGAIGLAAAEGKLAVGYGGEAGKMDDSLADLVRRYCQDALIIARNEASKGVLGKLGVASRSGTDTAWTFDPADPEVGRRILMDAGWDGEMEILALCPINPFWWPVKPNVPRAAMNSFSGLYDDSHYGSVYFHEEGTDVTDAQDRYLDAFAGATTRLLETHNVLPCLFGSEQLDRFAAEALNEKLIERLEGTPAWEKMPAAVRENGFPIIVSDDHDMYAMVSAMRQSTFMVSSRYHACVMTMAGGVISAGVTMDERIQNLMIDRGTPGLALQTDDPELEQHLYEVLVRLTSERDVIRAGIDDCVYQNLERMGQMGMILVDYVRRHHPEFPFRPELGETLADGTAGDPWQHLPSLAPAVVALVERVRAKRGAGATSDAPKASVEARA
jgi:polysaccharide pyruvyl transferase WcaK-like protein